MKEPCIDCTNKQRDEYGYLCDLSCGKRTAWANYQAGMLDVVGMIKSHTLIKPDENSITQFEPFYQIEQSELKEWLNG